MTDLVKQAEKNLVKIAASWEDAMKMLDALQGFGNKMCHEHIGKDEFFEGLYKTRHAVYMEYIRAISDCFIFAGVGGEETTRYSREKFKEAFNGKERFCVLNFLDKHGHRPHRWTSEEDDEFRRQAGEVLKEK
jgi:hypothetical protein